MVRQRPHHRGQVYSAPLTHQQGIELQEVCSCLSVLFVCLYLYQLYSPLRHLRYDREGRGLEERELDMVATGEIGLT